MCGRLHPIQLISRPFIRLHDLQRIWVLGDEPGTPRGSQVKQGSASCCDPNLFASALPRLKGRRCCGRSLGSSRSEQCILGGQIKVSCKAYEPNSGQIRMPSLCAVSARALAAWEPNLQASQTRLETSRSERGLVRKRYISGHKLLH